MNTQYHIIAESFLEAVIFVLYSLRLIRYSFSFLFQAILQRSGHLSTDRMT